MSQQNINQYNYKKWFITQHKPIFDISLSSDEKDYNEEVVFSNQIIGVNDGSRLPIHFDLNNPNSSQMFSLNYGDYNTGNTLVSLNYYNPNNDDLTCYTATSLCDIGLTGIDNGLTTQISGETLFFTMGLFTGDSKWNRFYYDRRFKLIPVTANTTTPIVLTLESEVNPGSVITTYNLISNTELIEDLTVSFTNVLGLLVGSPIVIMTGVTIPQGQTSGTTTITTNEDFNNLDRTFVISGVTFSSDEGFYLPQITPDIIFASQTPTPSVTPTITPTPSTTINPTVTPTITQTPTNTPTTTTTNTPTNTGTPTQTPTNTPTTTTTNTPTNTGTPTRTPTRTPTNTINPTPSSTFLITPTNTGTPTRTPTNTINPTPSSTFLITPTNTGTPSITQTLTPSSSPIIEPSPTPSPTMDTPPPINNFSWSFVDQTRSGLSSYIIIYKGNTVVNVISDDSGSFEVFDKDVVRIILNFEDGGTVTSRLDEDGNIIYVDSQNRVPSVLDSGNIVITGGAIYVADGFIST